MMEEEKLVKEFLLDGCVCTPVDISEEAFIDAFLEFIESKGWCYGGSIGEYNDSKPV